MGAMKASLESLNVGDTFLTKYHIRGLLGRGGQAVVFHGYDTYIDRHVAIKVMAHTSDTRREHGRRAQMEARVLCRLNHPNIVNVFDAGATADGLIYIIMELLRGRTLREVIRHVHKVTILEALSLGAQIADGVERAHQQHVIHRDLKPENIFVVDDNAVKVLDFGIAKFLTLTDITTQRDTLQGTLWYISPEHVQGFGVTARSDIYALGCILYEIIAGTPPCLIGMQEITTQSVAYSQISRMPPPLHEWVVSVPQHVGRVIHRMLMKDPAKRYGTMKEVADALRAAAARLRAEHGSTLELRELWRDPRTPTTSIDAPKGELRAVDALGDTPRAQRTPPTLEVGNAAPGRRSVTAAPVALPTVRLDPAIEVPCPPSRPEPRRTGAPQPGPTPVTPTAPRVNLRAAVAAERAGGAVSSGAGALLARRGRLVALAIALGTVAGILLGFTRGNGGAPSAQPGASPSTQSPETAATAAPPPSAQPDASPSASPSPQPVEAAATAATAAPAPSAQPGASPSTQSPETAATAAPAPSAQPGATAAPAQAAPVRALGPGAPLQGARAANTVMPAASAPPGVEPKPTAGSRMAASDGRASIPGAAPTSKRQTNPTATKEPSNPRATSTSTNKRTPAKNTNTRNGQTPTMRPPFSGADLD